MGKNKTILKGGFKSHEVEEEISDIVQGAKKQIGNVGSDFFGQLMGLKKDPSEFQKPTPDQVFSAKDPIGIFEVFNASKNKVDAQKQFEKAPKNEKREAAINYSQEILKAGERASNTEMREINERLKAIMLELQRLISSSRVLKMEFADVDVQQAPTQAGEYHLNFFDWLLMTIRAARQKVEDSGAWLKAVKGKNSKAHWGKISKKGADTRVTLSNERSVATQVG